MKSSFLAALAAAAFLATSWSAAHANTISFSSSNSNSTGNATLEFATGNGTLTLKITNDGSYVGSNNQTQAISYVGFSLPGFAISSYTGLSGRVFDIGNATSWTAASGTAFSASGATLPDYHWAFSAVGGNVVATAGTPASGTPEYMILPSAGTWPSNNGGKNFNPYIIGPATFTFSVPSMTDATILSATSFSSLAVGFGTSPDVITDVPPTGGGPRPVPLPAAAWAGLAMLGGMGLVKLRKKA